METNAELSSRPEGGFRDNFFASGDPRRQAALVDEDLDLFYDERMLDGPLPPLPEDLAEGEQAVVSRWVGPRWGALLVVGNYGPRPDPVSQGELQVDLDGCSFRRVPGGWESSNGDGGTNWWTSDPPLVRPYALDSRTWGIVHRHWGPDEGWNAPFVTGLAGSEAAWAEVTDADGTLRCRLEAPLGYFIVAWNGDSPTATLELFDEALVSLGRQELPRFPYL